MEPKPNPAGCAKRKLFRDGDFFSSLLDAQPGDYKKAVEIARTCGLAADEYEVDFMVKEVGLVRASRDAEKREVWEAIVRVATATLEAGGKLSKEKVAALGAVSHSLGG